MNYSLTYCFGIAGGILTFVWRSSQFFLSKIHLFVRLSDNKKVFFRYIYYIMSINFRKLFWIKTFVQYTKNIIQTFIIIIRLSQLSTFFFSLTLHFAAFCIKASYTVIGEIEAMSPLPVNFFIYHEERLQ